MTEEEFAKFRKARVAKNLEKPHSLHQLFDIYWSEILDSDTPILRRGTSPFLHSLVVGPLSFL